MEFILIIISLLAALYALLMCAGVLRTYTKVTRKLNKALNELYEADKEILKLRDEKDKAVKACKKYRENINLLYNNLLNLNDTYSENEENLRNVIEQNLFLAGQLEAYKKIYGELKEENN